MNPVVETARLALWEMTPNDVDFVAAMLADEEVTKYDERRFSRIEAEEWLSRQIERYRRDGHGLWLVTERDTGDAVGQVGLALQDVEGRHEPEVGWLLHRPFWGRGYATEAAIGVRDAAFARWSYPALISLVRPANLPSQRVAQRIGMTPGRRVQFHGFEHIVYGVESTKNTKTP